MKFWDFFKKPSAEMSKQQEAFEKASLENKTALLELQTKELELKKVQLSKMMEEEDRNSGEQYDFM